MKVPTDVAGLARLILSSECKSVVMLTGAGVSVASGIPDFRSPGGMYDTLRPDLITATPAQRQLMTCDPTYVVEREMFMENAFPYLEVRRPFILNTFQQKWKATLAHRFAELLHTKTNKLTRVYTQNIDGLDRQCMGIPSDKIINVHGSLGAAACESCGAPMEMAEFCQLVSTHIKDIYGTDPGAPSESSPIPCPSCGKHTVKPTTVLFGSHLPTEFFEQSEVDLPETDLLIVSGTSLVVSPANSLVYQVPDTTIRVVVNREQVGANLGIQYNGNAHRDFFAQGACDQVFLDLMEELNWLETLSNDHLNDLPKSSAQLLRDKLA
eukprot:scaffold69257_cov59-Attheya_sp.AAC.1